MRVAIVSTPRSGNTWVRSVLRDTLGLNDFAVHNYRELPPVLPDDAILQLHWYREPNFQAFLRERRFKVIVLSRHPLDVLISALHFVRHEPLTSRWLEGNAELPGGLADETPFSPGFERYATGWGAENLLSVSYQWWNEDNIIHARYEDLVAAPRREFGRLLAALGEDSRLLQGALEQALTRNSLDMFRGTANRHGWRGTPNIWRALIPPTVARRVRRRHARVFSTLGYRVPPYLLSIRQAERAWITMAP